MATIELVMEVAPHPLLELIAFETLLSDVSSPEWLAALLREDVDAPVGRSEAIRADARDLLRHGGYKPTGRGKPASEYLVKAAAASKLSSINLPVDACNVVSLHSGLPISVVDADKLAAPLRVAIVEDDEGYVFNSAGQEIRLRGLLCLHDASGPCSNAVKDSQRTKTSAETRRTLSIIWAPKLHAAHAQKAADWYRELLQRAGAETRDVMQVLPPA
jgi:DNA/RNA-binding domain of Phe-tRNA-synthetase-like protein